MDNRIKIQFFQRESHANKNGVPIFIRITIGKEKGVEFTSRLYNPEEWDRVSMRVRGRSVKAKNINVQLKAIEEKILDIHTKLINANKVFTAEAIRNIFQNGEEAQHTLLNTVKAVIEDRKRKGSTFRKYELLHDRLQAFIAKANRTDLLLGEIEYDFIVHFNDFIQGAPYNIGVNTAGNYTDMLKAVMYYAQDRRWVSAHPFMTFKKDKVEAKPKYLEESQLMAIEEAQMPTKRLGEYRDIFVFACYTGLAFADIKEYIKNGSIHQHILGGNWIKNQRVKGRHQKYGDYTIPLLDKAAEILKKYDNKLPLGSNQKYNRSLKSVATFSGLKVDLSSHVARHTFATAMLNYGVSERTLQRMLGHTSDKSTKIYAKVTDVLAHREMANVQDLINERRANRKKETETPIISLKQG